MTLAKYCLAKANLAYWSIFLLNTKNLPMASYRQRRVIMEEIGLIRALYTTVSGVIFCPCVSKILTVDMCLLLIVFGFQKTMTQMRRRLKLRSAPWAYKGVF